MKKLILLGISLMLTLSLVGCGDSGSSKGENESDINELVIGLTKLTSLDAPLTADTNTQTVLYMTYTPLITYD